MLYSIGKDSASCCIWRMKAFYPAKPPFPLLHVDTTWKFREMIAFRDETAKRLGIELIVHINQEGVARGINPVRVRLGLHTQVMKTEALKQALDKYGFDAAFGGARRDEEKSRAKERIFSHPHRQPCLGPAQPAARNFGAVQHAHQAGRIDARLSAVELDRAATSGNISRPQNHSRRAALFRQGAPGGASATAR